MVAINRAVALGEWKGAAAGLAALDEMGDPPVGYQPYLAARADLLRRVGRSDDARAVYDRAIAATDNPAERQFLERRRALTALR